MSLCWCFINYYSTIHEHIFDLRKYFMVTLACTCTFLRKHGAQSVISFDFENVEKSCTVCPLSHSVRTVLRDPLSYATFSIRSLEGSHYDSLDCTHNLQIACISRCIGFRDFFFISELGHHHLLTSELWPEVLPELWPTHIRDGVNYFEK